MVKFTIDQVRALMNVPENIRNVTVIAHVDHGKSTLTDSLINAAGITDDIGQRTTDTRKDEQLRGVTIKSTGITLFFENTSSEDKQGHLINLIDSPGHVDFSSEVTAALRLTDGALVLVDCVEGCCVQTETVLRQALRERIKPVLAINKLDRLFLELKMEHEDIYQSFCRALESVNLVISTQRDEIFDRDWTVYPERGTVAFTAGKQGWGFTLKQFAKLYTKKFGKSESELVIKFWGDNYFDTETKQWTTSPVSESGKHLPRAFCKYIVEPISKVFNACMSGDITALQKFATSMNIKLSQEELQLTEKDLIKAVMMKWLPAADALLEMVTDHLPSPSTAQKYRVETLYVGPQDDETADSIRKCDPNGPLVVFISKMVPTKDNSRFFAFGRVFSGTVSTGKKVRILGPNYVHGKKEDLFTDVPIQRSVIMMGKKTESVSSVPCGNTVALVGIDTYLSKSCTVTTDPASFPLINMKYSVAPVVRVAVSPKSPGDLLKLVEALKRLSKSDPLVQCSVEPTGEHVIACAGELHLEICINDLIEFMHGAEIVVSTPVVLFQETVTAQSESPCLAKSPNLHNRLWGQALPLDSGLVTAIEEGRIVKDEMRSRARTLNTEYGMDISDAKSIWAFGPNEVGPNMVTNLTRGVQYMHEIKDSVVAAFQWATKEGALANENMRGIHFSVVDALLHADTVHRGGGQLIPTARKVFYASQLTAKPALMEPVFLVEIQCPPESLSGIYSTLIPRRGTINEALPKGPGLYLVKAFLPVVESFGFTEALRAHTAGKAFPQCMFDHWAVEPSNPLEPNTKASDMVLAIRKRKGLPVELPSAAKFLDKL